MRNRAVFLFLAGLCLWLPPGASAESPAALLTTLDAFPHARQVNREELEVIDHEVGLGALQKVRGNWRFEDSERLTGHLLRYTWQIVDGFSSSEVLEEIEGKLEGARLLFSCDGRGCGRGVEWANRVFEQRVLYGRDDEQHYRVYDPEGNGDYRLLLFSSARTADRQYLHAELLTLER
ncbi:DUF4892 domain-containing protein [Seongchinamella sediminis]|uniref:DUF4892 domain-containing protein n=1 Tax=Seongchinamella sediminis TaxID=2283635 RepID=UPI0013C3709A|nr:DUF4892 domain-containing protein [Seongchinamella sediminis]